MESATKTLLIVYHSLTGGTQQMAESAAAGAAAGGGAGGGAGSGADSTLRISLLRAADAGPKEVLEADGYIFATPENLAAVSGQMKDFFDRTYYPVLDRINGRAYAVLICAGSDGRNAAAQIERIATGWRLKRIADPLIVCTHAQTPEEILRAKRIPAAQLKRCAELGATLAAGITLGIF